MLEEVVVMVWAEERLIPFELWSIALETYFVEYAKIVNNSLLHREINPHFWGCYKWYSSESFNDVRRSRRHCFSRRTAWLHLNSGV